MIGIWILGDRLTTQQLSLLNNQDLKEQTSVILIESHNYVRQRPYHRQKLVLVWSAMRHFAQELREAGWQVTYEIATDFVTPLTKWIEAHQITTLQMTTPCDRPFLRHIQSLN
jgi:deoxyribodipyrimidine photolyase-related protein